jgi:molecular chaperone DnaK
LNVHRTINSSTAAAIAFGIEKRAEVEDKFFMVCDLGGDAFNVSVVEFGSVITVEGTGGDTRVGGLEIDETVTQWALRQIQRYGVDLSSDDGVRYRLRKAAAQLKKTPALSESAVLSVPYLALVDGHVLSPELKITRAQFEALITPLLERVKRCIEDSMTRVAETSGVNWEDINGCLLVGGCSRLPVVQKILRELFEQHCPGIEPEFHMDLNPDEAAAMGAAILGTQWAPIGIPPDRDESEKLEAQGHNLTFKETDPDIELLDVTSHTLGIALDGVSFHRLIHKNTFLPVSVNLQGFTNGGNSITEMVWELFQGEEDFVAANTRIGEVRIVGLEPLPRGQHRLQVEFIIENNGRIETICTDLRTDKIYPSRIVYGDPNMGQEEIKKWQAEVEARMPDGEQGKSQSPISVKISPDIKEKVKPIPKEPLVVPQLALEKIPAEWRDYWVKCQSLLPQLDSAKHATLARAMIKFADAVKMGNPVKIEENGSLLQDALLEVWI